MTTYVYKSTTGHPVNIDNFTITPNPGLQLKYPNDILDTYLGTSINRYDDGVLVSSDPEVPVMARKTLTGGVKYKVDDLISTANTKSSTPKDGPIFYPRSALTRSLQTIWRAASTQLDIFSRSGGDFWLRSLKKDLFTATASAGVSSQFWRFVKLIALSGAVSVPTATPSAAGAFTTAVRNMHPDTGSGGQAVASGIVYGSSTLNDVITWSVTVPASGIVQCLLLASSGAANNYTVSCGGQSKSGTLTQSATAGLLPQVITLYGCTAGAQTLSVTKTSASGTLYTTGLCSEVGLTAPVAASSMIYWFDAASRYIDGDGSNDIALNIGGTFYGSYHGGHYGATTFKLDGAVVDVTTGGPVFSASEISVEHEGRIGSIGISSQTLIVADGHAFDARLRADALAMTEAHVLMAGCRGDMTLINAESVAPDSTYHPLANRAYVDAAIVGRSKALTACLESISVNGAEPVGMYSQAINTGVAGYCKGYVTIPIAALSSLDLRCVWTY